MKHLYFCACTEDGGIYHYILENENVSFCEKVDLDKPMYIAIEDNKAYVILKETDKNTKFGGTLTFDIDENGRLINPTEIISSQGIVPCHLSVVNGKVYTVNYLSGNVVKLPDTVSTHSGKGPHPTRQTEAHTHFVSPTPDGKYVLCTDLGIDSIFTYTLDLKQLSVAKVPEGYGARHLAFSDDGKLVYCVNELVSSVSVFDYDDGVLTYLNTYECLPDFKEKNTAAAIRIKGKYLYISNRGAETITRLEICGKELRLLENTYCGGKNPRDFLIVDDLMFCTNELTNDVTILKLVDGKPVLTEQTLNMPNPLCVISL
ncbi:MAG: lactonase family protein [Clostridia bacterium]|nr:lactonase family protein [Clostridia bacterium]